jgi:manganese transport system ATP-binding protein
MVPVRNDGPDAADRCAVTLKRADLGYGRPPALRAVDLCIGVGERAVLIGPNGAGKTTLLHGIAGLLSPVSGTVRVLGAPPADRRVDIAYVLQGARVGHSLPITVEEVVRMGHYPRLGLLGHMTAEDKASALAALDRLGVADLRHRHLGELSGGQRQRVVVAQALVQRAAVLLLDEPLTGLDLPTQQTIDDVLDEERARGATVVLSTHDLSDTEGADRVVLLSGRVVADGRPAEVLVADRLVEAYGGRLMRLGDGSVILDDGPHHDHDAGGAGSEG